MSNEQKAVLRTAVQRTSPLSDFHFNTYLPATTTSVYHTNPQGLADSVRDIIKNMCQYFMETLKLPSDDCKNVNKMNILWCLVHFM